MKLNINIVDLSSENFKNQDTKKMEMFKLDKELSFIFFHETNTYFFNKHWKNL